MAKNIEIIVGEVQIAKRISARTSQEYTEITIIDTQREAYKGILEKGLTIPEKGSKVTITYQEVRGRNSIIKIDPTINPIKINTWDEVVKPIDSCINTITKQLIEAEQMTKKTQDTVNGNREFFKMHGTLYYAHIKEKDTRPIVTKKGTYPAPNCYHVDVSVSEEDQTRLEKLGVEVKNKGDDKGDFVRMKSNYQPEVVDVDGTKLTPENIPLMGNGTTAIITVKLYPNKAPNGGENCLGLNKVELEHLVPYTKKEARMLSDD